MLNAILWIGLAAQVDDAAVKAALDQFKHSFGRATSSAARANAVLELSRTPHQRTFNQIAPLLGMDDKDVKVAAAKGLGNYTDYKKLATPALMTAFAGAGKDADFKAAIIDGLAKLGDVTALTLIHRSFHDEHHEKVVRAAIGATGAIRARESLDALYDFMEEIKKWLAHKQGGAYEDDKGKGDDNAQKTRLENFTKDIIKAFQAITRERWTTVNEWEIWCGKHKADFVVPK